MRAEVSCTGTTHHVTWRRGRLVVEDHDLTAERALRGLGAATPRCLDVLDAWRELNQHSALDDLPRLLTSDRRARDDDRLPASLQRVAALTAIVRCERHWDDADFPENGRRVVGGELNRCFGAAIEQSLAAVRDGRARLRVRSRFEMVGPGDTASLALEVHPGRNEIRLRAALPVSWLIEVWSRGVAAVDGQVVIEAEGESPDRVAVVAIDWGLSRTSAAGPRLVSVWLHRTNNEWRLDGDAEAPRLARRPWWSVEVMPR